MSGKYIGRRVATKRQTEKRDLNHREFLIGVEGKMTSTEGLSSERTFAETGNHSRRQLVKRGWKRKRAQTPERLL